MNFPQAFALVDGSKRPAVMWSKPENCRPSETFTGRMGVPTGPCNGIWILDLDKKNGKDGQLALMAFADGRGIPDTYTVRTPSGGVHLYFTWDETRPVGNSIGILDGVDVRGQGGYACAGGDYRVVVDVPLTPAPDWLLDLVTSRQDISPTGEVATAITPDHPDWFYRCDLATQFVANEPACISGQGGQVQIWKLALRLMRTYELPVSAAMSVLASYNARCVPPWEPHELERTLIRAAEEGQGVCGMPLRSTGGLFGADPKVPAPPSEGEWRQRYDPKHVYTFDVSSQVAGAALKIQSYGAKELAAAFTGPGAYLPWRGVWRYDRFRRATRAINPPMPLDAEKAGLSKRDLSAIQVWLACAGARATHDQIFNAIDVAARVADYHPVLDYLDSLEKVPGDRANDYFTGIAGRLWGAEERNELESSHLRRLAIAAVRRVKVPGTKVDVMLVFAGEQGFRKSAFCALLFGEWFLDQVPPISSGRGIEASVAIEGRWGVEIAEMSAFSRAHEAAKKEFLTRCVDKYRPVFGIAVQEWPRQCVFIGTTNEEEFLDDPTGDTRYDVCDVKVPIALESIDRDEFWACAVALEASGEDHWRDRAALARVRATRDELLFANGGVAPIVIPENEAFARGDAWSDAILAAAEKHIAADGFTTWAWCILDMGIPLERQDDRTINRVRGILRRRYGASAVVRVDGRVRRVYRPS